ncbi:MAG: hypothetical protein LBH19_01230 [Dysgonamonadaceae bacterium]|nr:hypothetical protein [Dysgonamonadaceae bacterium]
MKHTDINTDRQTDGCNGSRIRRYMTGHITVQPDAVTTGDTLGRLCVATDKRLCAPTQVSPDNYTAGRLTNRTTRQINNRIAVCASIRTNIQLSQFNN